VSDLRDRIAAAIVGHADYVSAGIRYCSCGWVGDSQYTRISFAKHVADAVIAALPLHRNDEEDEYGGYKPTGRYRYVTDWMADV
jgi:hypothetical protein